MATVPLDSFPFELENCAQVLFFRINTPISDPVDVTANFRHGELNRCICKLLFLCVCYICIHIENVAAFRIFSFIYMCVCLYMCIILPININSCINIFLQLDGELNVRKKCADSESLPFPHRVLLARGICRSYKARYSGSK